MRSEYERRLSTRRAQAAAHERQSQSLGLWRLAVVAGGAVLAWWNWYLLPIPVVAFMVLLILHERIIRRAEAERRAVTFYEQSLARLDHRWAGIGENGERFRQPAHPYAEDLDLFGHGSAFQLINSARTAAGEAALAAWLTAPSSIHEVKARHAAVDELRPRLDLREDLALLGQDVRAGLHEAALVGWSNRAPVAITPLIRLAAFLLALGFVVAVAGYFVQAWSLRPVLLVILGEFAFSLFIRDRIREIRAAADLPAADLRLIAALLQRFEAERFESGALQNLRQRLSTGGRPAYSEIERLRRLIEWHDQARNQFFALLAAPLLWSTQFAFAIERWRQRSGAHISDWLNAIGELEALSSLGGYAAEHPDDPFPELATEGPVFEAEGITHPLLPEDTAVRNDVRLGGEIRLLLVSGSNMSGKSTLLRSVGLNTVLAWAGAPVRCRQLRLSPLAVGASLRTHDSIQDGKSRFYAEISRLRQIVDMTGGDTPLLYLLDELLSGTNSHDRRIGAEALIRSLAERRTIGLVTTHDLALTAVAEALGPVAANVHFEDHLEEGRIAFDYRMRPGVVTKSNAIELMRAVGLPV